MAMVREFRCAECGAAGAVTALPPSCETCGSRSGDVYGRDGDAERLLASFRPRRIGAAPTTPTTVRRLMRVRDLFARGERESSLRATQAQSRLDWARAANELERRRHYARLRRNIAAEIVAMRTQERPAPRERQRAARL